MNCNKCGGKLVELFTSVSCERCDGNGAALQQARCMSADECLDLCRKIKARNDAWLTRAFEHAYKEYGGNG